MKNSLKIFLIILGVMAYGLPLITNSAFIDEIYGIITPFAIGWYIIIDSIKIKSYKDCAGISGGCFLVLLSIVLALDTINDDDINTYKGTIFIFIITLTLWFALFLQKLDIRL
jgi:hypothetical protein